MHYSYFPLVLLVVFQSFSEQRKPFTAYEEKIPGTEISLSMVPIAGGSFTMGSDMGEQGRSQDEGPAHLVSVSPFWMASHETTWDLYHLFMAREVDQMGTGPVGNEVSLDVDAVAGATTPYVEMSFGMGTEGYPAICMTQYAAVKFCEWLSALTGHFYRLPTEAEWEYAARAGNQTSYAFGNDPSKLNDYAWHRGNSNGAYHKVGQKKPNAWGLYDMHGNVAEWSLDHYRQNTYTQRAGKKVADPWEKPTKTYPRTVRGGSWKHGADQLRSASRMASHKDWKMRDPQIPKSKWWHTDAPFVGFRVVRPYATPSAQEQKQYWKEKHTK